MEELPREPLVGRVQQQRRAHADAGPLRLQQVAREQKDRHRAACLSGDLHDEQENRTCAQPVEGREHTLRTRDLEHGQASACIQDAPQLRERERQVLDVSDPESDGDRIHRRNREDVVGHHPDPGETLGEPAGNLRVHFAALLE